jgi:D-alanyl-D-alanine carboxypeptidase
MMDMAKILSKHKMDLPDVMMVGGVDDGTLMGVYEQAPLRGSVVAKTGTIAHAVALAGFINTAQGRVYFGMFLQTRKILRARQVRNQMVAKIANHFGGSRPIDYDHGYRFVSFGQQSGLKKVESGLIAMP